MLFHVYPQYKHDKNTDKIIIYSNHDEAKKAKGIRIDRRIVDTPEKIPKFEGNKELADKCWYSEGRNHRVVNGYIERDFDDEFFIIEINTIEDLLNFQEKYGINATISNNKSGYIYKGEELLSFYCDYYME